MRRAAGTTTYSHGKPLESYTTVSFRGAYANQPNSLGTAAPMP